MPIYAYRCQACGQSFDRLFKSIAKIPKTIACPQCASRKVRRLVTAPNVRATDGVTSSSDAAYADTADAPVETGLFGRKELNEVVKKRKKAGLAG
jgi:putative FmdB family regulatory protein